VQSTQAFGDTPAAIEEIRGRMQDLKAGKAARTLDELLPMWYNSYTHAI
jgi:hypothetical protein